MKDIMKLSDIDGAQPALIPGYTGAKPHQLIARNGSMPNFGPAKVEIDTQWNKLRDTQSKRGVFNPSVYKEQFNHGIYSKPLGLIPTTTDSRILQSQAPYRSNRAERIIHRKKKVELDDTFVKHEIELMAKNDETFKDNQNQFFMQTPKEHKFIDEELNMQPSLNHQEPVQKVSD
jgi:hypothetical protein